MQTRIYGHGPFLGNTGYNIHTRNFFTALNKHFVTKIRNVTQGDVSKLSSYQKDMLGSLSPNKDSNLLNIVLSETYGSKYIDDAYEGSKVLYNVWESTKYPTEFFEIAMKYDQLWVPSEWQKDITIKQGYPKHKVFVVPEGVNPIFKPNPDIKRNNDQFTFILVGKWEYRKSTKEIIQCFLNTFSNPNIRLRLLVSNPFSDNTTITNLKNMGVDPNDSRLEIIDYVDDDEYLYLLQTSDAFISCSRSEGWNLPLIESMAVGMPSICSNCSGQMEFAKYGAFLVDILKEMPASLNVSSFPGNYYEPDFRHLSSVMREIYDNYDEYKNNALEVSNVIHTNFSWDNAALKAKSIIDNFTFNLADTVKNTKVLTVATKQTKELRTLLTSCKYNNITLTQLEANTQSSDFNIKLKELNSYLSKQDNNDIILFVDEHSSYFLDAIKTIIEKFINLKCDILISSEVDCFPDKNLSNKYNDSDSLFRYVNSGGFIGYTQPLKLAISKLLDIQINSTSEYKNNDQYLWSTYCMDNDIKLDYDCDIFQCLNSTKTSYFELEGVRYKNKITNSFPSILHVDRNSENVLYDLINKINKSKIFNTSIFLESDGPRINFSYKGYSIDVGVSIKDKYTNKILYASNMSLDDNINYFIKANCDISTIEYIELEIKDLNTVLYNKIFNITKLHDHYFYVPHTDGIVNLKKDNSLLNFTYKEIFENKEYEKEFCHIKPGDVVVDCGANIGIFTRYAYKLGASKVISFEPVPDNYKCLIKNISNGSNSLHNMAISNTNGYKTLYLDKNAGGHSIIREDINNTKLGTSVDVECINLDSLFDNEFVSKIDFLKVDVEGAELEVFEGISDSNLSKVDRIVIEYHHAKFNFDENIRTTFLDRFQKLGFKYFILYLGDNKHLQMIYIWKNGDIVNDIDSNNYTINYNFVNGPFCELKGDSITSTYNIDFIDTSINQVVYTSSNMKINHWASASRKWFTNWKIKITNNETTDTREIDYDPIGKRVYVAIDSKSLGDTIAWFPYAEEFRKKWNCKMIVSTFWNDLFKGQYPYVEFIEPGVVVNDLYAMYSIGWYSMQDCKNPHNFLNIPMQQTASDILGLDYRPIKPNIAMPEVVPTEEKYVCIGVHSTCQAKYWNNKDGWQKVVNYLNDMGYKVYSISKEPDGYMGNYLPKGVIDKSGDISIMDRIKCLANAKFFIGIGSGLSWLAWAVGIPVVMISGFSSAIIEFPADIRIESNSTCKNCFNRYRLDPSKWLWCPDDNNFECTASILPEYVIDKISNKFMSINI